MASNDEIGFKHIPFAGAEEGESYFDQGYLKMIYFALVFFGFASLTALAIGIAALVRHETGSTDNGSSMELFCVPSSQTRTSFQNPPVNSPVAYTRVQYSRIGNTVEVKLQQEYKGFVYWENNSAGRSDLGINSNCIPPSANFASPDYNFLIPFYSAPFFAETSIINHASLTTGSNYPILTIASPFPGQVLFNDILYYGIQAYIGVADNSVTNIFTDNAYLGVWIVKLSYTTNASSNWQVPEYCKGGECNLSP